MSDPLRIGLVAEGQTDHIVVNAGLKSILNGRSFVLTLVQPESFAAFGAFGGGWSGVYRWCRNAVDRTGGAFHEDIVFSSYDIVVIHVDADVASKQYSDAGIHEAIHDLPCSRPCPPPSSTTDQLRRVILRWLGETSVPQRTVLMTPSKCLEAWVMAALYPDDPLVARGTIECRESPEAALAGRPSRERLVRKKGTGYDKMPDRYRDRADEITAAWRNVRRKCTEADRFSVEFAAAVGFR